LIFRDYEDLIKTGKKEVDIDFTKSGEPKMSLKEWKNNEINTKLMKKWGLLKEGCPSGDEFDPKGPNVVTDEEDTDPDLTEWAPGFEPYDATHDFLGNPLSSAPKGTKPKSTRWYAGDSKPSEREDPGGAARRAKAAAREAWIEKNMPAQLREDVDDAELEEGGMAYRDDDEEEGFPASRRHDNPMKALGGEDYEGIGSKEDGDEEGNRPSMARDMDWHGQRRRPPREANVAGTRWQKAKTYKNLGPVSERNQKISVREAKQITRRIIERVRKEGK
jgi:hypothetical protein